jgi:hypothetical protein
MTETPWGPSQTQKTYAPGIISYSTAGHGGFHLDPEQNLKIDSRWRNEDGWYEEDCEWAKVAFTFPEAFRPSDVLAAKETLKNDYPHGYGQISGIPVNLGESSTLREEIWQAEHKNHLQVISAMGDWCTSVPDGMVGVVMILPSKLDSRTHQHDKADERYFLVPAAEYTGGHFVIEDEKKYHEIPSLDYGIKLDAVWDLSMKNFSKE